MYKRHKKNKEGEQAGERSEFSLNPSFGEEIFKTISHVKEVPRIPINNLFTAVQFIGKKETVEFGKGNKKYCISFGNYEPRSAREKALFLSVYYALIYYSAKRIDRILLTDLMENIGYLKILEYGYKEFQKEEVIETVWNVTKLEIGVSGNSVPKSIRKLFPDVEKKDIFKINIFSINIIKQYSSIGKLKNAVILFKPNFDRSLIRFSTIEVLGLPISEPEYKNLAIYVVYGRNISDKRIKKTVRELLEIAKIEIDRAHPERVWNKFLFALRKIKADGYIKDFTFNPYPYGKRDEREISTRSPKNWFDKWLDAEVIIAFPKD